MTKELSIKKCCGLLEKYKVPKIIFKHSEAVAKIAYIISKKLNKNGYDINVNCVVYASLLHDIFKIIEINNYGAHSDFKEVKEKKEFWDILKNKFDGLKHQDAFALEFGKKYPNISKIVSAHVYSNVNNGFDSWEEKILFYADALVKHDKIVDLKTRLEDAHNRYAFKHKLTHEQTNFAEKTDSKIFELQDEIFKITSLTPDELIKLNDVKLKDLIKDE